MNLAAQRSRVVGRLLALGLCAMFALVACGSSAPPGTIAPGVGLNDINPAPRDRVRDGGQLRWPIDVLPENFNYNEVAGATESAQAILGALMPYLFTGTADGTLVRNDDYLSSAQAGETPTQQQIVTYWINPHAVWSNGTPITWRDFAAQWQALRGTNPAYHVAGTNGYSDIESVRPGTDNQQVMVTFRRPYAEWQTLFSPLYPISVNSDPQVFNDGLVGKLPLTAGPFQLDSIDPAAKTVTVRRSDTWWGTPAKLDRIVFKVVDRASLGDALATNQIDFYKIGSSIDLLKRAQSIPGLAIRQSPERQYNQLTFNGATGRLLADVRLRQAIARGIDRTAIAKNMVGPIVPDVTELGNHIYPFGSRYYRDHSSAVSYDANAANQALDALGWVRQPPNGVRVRGGVPLRLNLLEGVPNSIAQSIDRAVADQLAALGVQVVIQPVPLEAQAALLRQGDFDLTSFAWAPTATPLASSRGIYATPAANETRQNYGQIADPRIDALFDQGLAELDEHKRASIGNHIDRLLWQDVHSLPLYPSTGAYAVRANLANFGAPGFADIDYVNAGFLK